THLSIRLSKQLVDNRFDVNLSRVEKLEIRSLAAPQQKWKLGSGQEYHLRALFRFHSKRYPEHLRPGLRQKCAVQEFTEVLLVNVFLLWFCRPDYGDPRSPVLFGIIVRLHGV